MKKVLIITYYWPPSGGAGVQRWLKFVKYLRDFGWEPVVYTAENPEVPYIDESLLEDIPNNIEVIKVPIFEPYRIYNFITRKKKQDGFHHGFLKEDSAQPKFTERISIWLRGNLFIPDARMFWIWPSYKFLRKYLLENKIDVIISTGPPHSAHLIALKLRKKFNIPWIADFRDPWTGIYYFDKLKISYLSKKIHNMLESSCLNKADLIITVGETMKKDFKKLTSKPIEVITNGFDHSDYANLQRKNPEKFNIMYTGMFLPDQNPSELWKVLNELVNSNKKFAEELKLTFIGKVDNIIIKDIELNNLRNHLEIRDSVPHNQLADLQQEAALLLLCINRIENASYILTGKFFEYLASGKRILALCPEESDVASIIKETKSGIAVGFSQSDLLKSSIELLFDQYLNKGTIEQNDAIWKYSREELTKRLSILLNKVIN
ncbi:MAG: glycosyltransferase family 4 protein [Bacteroidales bacterium]|nr:glycosyltransferase family 4 protein [Bacteroidales bacterium]